MILSDDRVSLVCIYFYFLYLSLSFLTSPDVGLSLFSYLEKKEGILIAYQPLKLVFSGSIFQSSLQQGTLDLV